MNGAEKKVANEEVLFFLAQCSQPWAGCWSNVSPKLIWELELAYDPNEISHMIFLGDHGKRQEKRSSLYPYAFQHQ